MRGRLMGSLASRTVGVGGCGVFALFSSFGAQVWKVECCLGFEKSL